MKNNPISPAQHGTIDYIFLGKQLFPPTGIGMNRNAATTYGTLGPGFLAVNACTETPAGLKRNISFKDHQKAD